MPLSLEQYATYLDTRDLTWPAPPEIKAAKARPHLTRLSGIRAVTWNILSGSRLRASRAIAATLAAARAPRKHLAQIRHTCSSGQAEGLSHAGPARDAANQVPCFAVR